MVCKVLYGLDESINKQKVIILVVLYDVKIKFEEKSTTTNNNNIIDEQPIIQ